MLNVLIVGSEPATRELLAEWCGRQGMSCRTAGTLAEARLAVVDDRPDLALVDLELPDGSGLQLLAALGESPEISVVLIAGRSTTESVMEAFRLGAREVLGKPIKLPQLEAVVKRCAVTTARRRDLERLRNGLRETGCFGDMVGRSPPMQKLYGAIERVAPTDETVCIIGQTGTGKELVARMLHRLSRRASEPFIALNCGAVATSLIESELFGHERGAFTGAHERRHGVFEQAQGGTLFLDEITEIMPDMQVRLLRVLEAGVLTRVGGTGEISFDVRILASTNRDPHEAVESGVLRRDLFYRIYVFPLELPPLEERGEDLTLLALSFLERLNEENHVTKRFTPEALEQLGRRSWPGNVRELRNTVRRAWILSGDLVDVAEVTLDVRIPEVPAAGGEFKLQPGTSISDAERKLIEATLVFAHGDKRRSAALLGISIKTLYSRLSLYAAAQ